MQKQFHIPLAHSQAELERLLAQWLEKAPAQSAALGAWMVNVAQPGHPHYPLLAGLFGNSPHLSRLLLMHPQLLHDILDKGADRAHSALAAELVALWHEDTLIDMPTLMRSLRIAKGKLALMVGIADVAGLWELEQVTGALSDFAEQSLSMAIDWLLAAAARRGEITLPHPHSPSRESGIIVLGMGKLGGRELNYSSDIDLIIFFEPERLGYKGRHTEQHFMNKLAHDIVQVMQERTSDGYVFRTDLRLRPDPASTPPAITTSAAYYYYESVGQNWERAAMIKARPVAGDVLAGEAFLKGIGPFMWRRNLDFVAINDIHSIKRQMDSTRSKIICIAGHNIKLGLGGIREIEFYVQIHQLIWGGREPILRMRATCETLSRLVEVKLVDEKNEMVLRDAYGFLRQLEHRLQMVADEQTHSLPEDDDGLQRIAHFMGYDDFTAFSGTLMGHLHAVHDIYASSFQTAEQLGDVGNLVFTGVSSDPETLATLRGMGYVNPETVSEIVMGWHHGSTRATRTKRARELLTELMPALLKRLAETANPDAAFLRFNEFLKNLPAGVQLFSLFNANPHLLGLIADIMGSAPTLADTLSKAPDLLDGVLYADFYESLPSKQQLGAQWLDYKPQNDDFEQVMNALRRFRGEKQFQAGVQFLKHMISAEAAGQFLSNLADVMVQETLNAVMNEFTRSYGRIEGGRFAIIALGKLGSREMTFSSDIDMVFTYDVPDFEALSDGEKQFTASVYYNRFAQRLVNAFSALSNEGRLYEVDTRLRPSGKQGLLAVSTKALGHYFDELAWTFEYMAFTKARPVAGNESLQEELDEFICELLARPRDMEKLKTDVAEMRERTDKEFPTDNPWNIKYARGGLMDLDFIAQYLVLRHAPETLGARAGSSAQAFQWLKQSRRLDTETADRLIEAEQFLNQVFNMLRLCCDTDFNETGALPGLKKILYQSLRKKSFEELREQLIRVEQEAYALYTSILIE